MYVVYTWAGRQRIDWSLDLMRCTWLMFPLNLFWISTFGLKQTKMSSSKVATPTIEKYPPLPLLYIHPCISCAVIIDIIVLFTPQTSTKHTNNGSICFFTCYFLIPINLSFNIYLYQSNTRLIGLLNINVIVIYILICIVTKLDHSEFHV